MLYTVVNGKVVIDLGILRIAEFSAIWDRDDSINKEKANAELDFVYNVCDYRSPYRKMYRDDQLLEAVTNDFMFKLKNWKVDAIVATAISKYMAMRDTASYKDYRAIDKSMEVIRNLCIGFIIPESLDVKDKLDVAKAHLDMVKKYEEAIMSMSKIRSRLEKDMTELDAKGKGQSKVRDRERRMESERQTL